MKIFYRYIWNMMYEIKVILDPSTAKSLKGTTFEKMIKSLLDSHQYESTLNINYTGMEIDLVCKHKVRDEELYVECKAKEKLESQEIHTFSSKVIFKKADQGYFIHTKEAAHQVAGLMNDMKEDPDQRYKNLTFIGPRQIIQSLCENKKIVTIDESGLEINKKILAATYFGDFYIFILDSNLTTPEFFAAYNAQTGEILSKGSSEIKNLKKQIKEIDILEAIESPKADRPIVKRREIDIIAEVQESENWYDYLPTSLEHFVGRTSELTNFFRLCQSVLDGTTKRRVFYLTSKSGWGKSSFIRAVCGKSRNKRYKNKYFSLAIDSRSISSNNFVALSVDKLIKDALKEGFLDPKKLEGELKFLSNEEIFTSSYIQRLQEYLKKEKKLLILTFDQFEDIFQREGYSEVFYKFLCDATSSEGNILIGFSWRKEFLIPSENSSYHYWTQAKEHAQNFTLQEFGVTETAGVIKQLEVSLGKKLKKEIKDRIIAASQGFPWLIKKLCIHVLKQVERGVPLSRLDEQELNIKALFEEDLEGLSPDEILAIRDIAKKCKENGAISILETHDSIDQKIIESLIQKRLLIRTGEKISLYWDIFRDYLITDEVPVIGESYILRSSVNSCLSLFMMLETPKSVKALEKELKHAEKYVWNLLHDLIELGIVKRTDNDKFVVKAGIEITENAFKEIVKLKFKRNMVYIEVLKQPELDQDGVLLCMKKTYKNLNAADKTWLFYTNTFISWLELCDLNVTRLSKRGPKGVIGNLGYLNKISAKKCLQVLEKIRNGEGVCDNTKGDDRYEAKALSFLVSLDLVKQGKLSRLTEDALETSSLEIILANQVSVKVELVTDIIGFYEELGKWGEKSENLIAKLPDYFNNFKSEKTKKQYATLILGWVKFVNIHSDVS